VAYLTDALDASMSQLRRVGLVATLLASMALAILLAGASLSAAQAAPGSAVIPGSSRNAELTLEPCRTGNRQMLSYDGEAPAGMAP